MNKILAAAQIIAAARRNRAPLHSLAADMRPADEAEGYRIQRARARSAAAAFRRLVGFKIGCTSAVMQQYLGYPASLRRRRVRQGRSRTAARRCGASDFVRVGVECEIAVRLGARSAAIAGAVHGRQRSRRPIEAYLPAIEIVDDRYVDWQTLGAPTLVADDFFAAGCVLGQPVARSAAPDLLDVVGRAVINGAEAGRGTGADVLGHPHHALAWLANHLAADGKGLRAGQIVLTGSLVKTIWLAAGDAVESICRGSAGYRRSSASDLAPARSESPAQPLSVRSKKAAASARGADGGRVEHLTAPRFAMRCGSSLGEDQNGSSTSITCWP